MRARTIALKMMSRSHLLALAAVAILPAALIPLGAATNAAATNLPAGVYIVPAGGYSVDECLAKSAECGRVVANAWCEANGHGNARAFGSARDITFSAGVQVKAPPRDSVIIACNE